MYIYLFAILPIFYSIIIYLLFIFLIIYWLATVGDHCRRPLSATYCRRPRVGDLLKWKSRKLQDLLRRIRILRLECLIVTFYGNLNYLQVLSASVGDLVGDLAASKKTRGHIYEAKYVYIHTCKTLSRHYHVHINI